MKNPTLLCCCTALALAGCRVGAADDGGRPLDCGDYAFVATPLGRLSNNVWNQQAAGGAPKRQCLMQRSVADDGSGRGGTQYGWSWHWPEGGGAVCAYPEIVVGAKPWDAGPGNDPRFPRRVADTRRLIVSYAVDTVAGGSHNLAASIWLIRTPRVAAPPDPTAIAAEIMVWTDSTPASFTPGGSLRGRVTVDGIEWEVWAAEDWRDSAGVHVNRWTYVVYRALQSMRTARYDARKLIADAVARGLASADLYIADVELGNEIVGGSGRTWLKAFSVDVD